MVCNAFVTCDACPIEIHPAPSPGDVTCHAATDLVTTCHATGYIASTGDSTLDLPAAESRAAAESRVRRPALVGDRVRDGGPWASGYGHGDDL